MAACVLLTLAGLAAGCGGSSPLSGDLALISVTPVQALNDESRVIDDRYAVARITVASTFSRDVTVPVRFFMSACGTPSSSPAGPGACTPTPVYSAGNGPPSITIRPGEGSYYVGPPDLADARSLSDATACVNVDIDYGNTLAETDESNNRLASCRPIVETVQLRIFYIPIALNGDQAPSCDAVRSLAARSSEYIEGVYPVADVWPRALQSTVSCHTLTYEGDFDARNALEHGAWRDDAGNPAPPTSTVHHDAFVGVYTQGAITAFGVGSAGQPWNDFIDHSAVVDDQQLDGLAAAQELSHNFGWVLASDPNNDGTGHLRDVPAPGYWVKKGCQMGTYHWPLAGRGGMCDPSSTPLDFMVPLGGTAHPVDATHWVSQDTWDFLVSSLMRAS
jgi:hypothetical protein